MPLQEQRNRMILMQRRLQEYDVVRWVNDFLEQLKETKKEQQKLTVKVIDEKVVRNICHHYVASEKIVLMIDYDGTLVPIRKTPSEAVPDSQVKEIIGKLSADPKNHVAVISGRDA